MRGKSRMDDSSQMKSERMKFQIEKCLRILELGSNSDIRVTFKKN